MSRKIIGVTVGTPISPEVIAKKINIQETDPTVPSWAKEPNKPIYTADDVNADTKGTASNLVAAHNTGTDAHNDIRLLIQGVIARLDAVANSSDEDLDQLSEIVTYIKSNKSLIDSITTSKISVADIINNLTTNVTDKPLSAAQGVVLKALIDAITVPTKVSQLENDTGYAKKTDIPTVPTALSQLSQDSTHRVVTDSEKASWNGKSNFSGSYNDLTNKPTIPSAYSHPSTHPASMITGLATVATSGKYSDLSGRPTIPTVPSSLPANGGNADTVDGYHIRTGTSGAAGYITFVV